MTTARFRQINVLFPFLTRDRLWLSAGLTYAFNEDASIDVGASYMHGQKVKFTEGEGAAAYSFESEGKARLFGTNFNYAF